MDRTYQALPQSNLILDEGRSIGPVHPCSTAYAPRTMGLTTASLGTTLLAISGTAIVMTVVEIFTTTAAMADVFTRA